MIYSRPQTRFFTIARACAALGWPPGRPGRAGIDSIAQLKFLSTRRQLRKGVLRAHVQDKIYFAEISDKIEEPNVGFVEGHK